MNKLEKMLEKKKKGGREMSDNEKEAKMHVVKDMRDMASDEMSKRLGALKKVSVASDSKAGLKEGLDKAKDLMDMMPEDAHKSGEDLYDETKEQDGIGDSAESAEDSHDAEAHEGEESPEEEAAEEEKEHDAMSPEELDAEIKKLMLLKHQKEMKKGM